MEIKQKNFTKRLAKKLKIPYNRQSEMHQYHENEYLNIQEA